VSVVRRSEAQLAGASCRAVRSAEHCCLARLRSSACAVLIHLHPLRQPFPVDIRHTKNDRLRKEIDGALRSTYYMANKGSCA
jgi:hypothetical protein